MTHVITSLLVRKNLYIPIILDVKLVPAVNSSAHLIMPSANIIDQPAALIIVL